MSCHCPERGREGMGVERILSRHKEAVQQVGWEQACCLNGADKGVGW